MDGVTRRASTVVIAGRRAEDLVAWSILDQAPSFGADTLLLSMLAITLGVPVFYLTGLRYELLPVLSYVTTALLVPGLAGLAVWWIRWYRPTPLVVREVMLNSIAYAFPAAVGVFALCSLGMGAGLLGVGIMVFIAAVVTTVSSAMFGFSGSSGTMTALRIASVVLVPLAVLGLTEALPLGLTAIGMWCIPLPVAAAGSIGAARGLQYHVLRWELADEDDD